MAVVAGARTPAAGAVPPAARGVSAPCPVDTAPAPRDAGSRNTRGYLEQKNERVSERLESCLSVFFRT